MNQTELTRPFPWKCSRCGKRSVYRSAAPYSLEIEHDGRLHTVEVAELDAPRCRECGEIVMDDHTNHQVSDAFRKQLGLLSPEEIRRNREVLGLTPGELSEALGAAEATLRRWETGGEIPGSRDDRLLRIFFEFPSVRDRLARKSDLRNLGAVVQMPVPTPAPTSFIPAERELRAIDLSEWGGRATPDQTDAT